MKNSLKSDSVAFPSRAVRRAMLLWTALVLLMGLLGLIGLMRL